jgi:hypothetical protein
MKKTILPLWCCPAPTQIGDGQHRKVSADGWCTFCAVHLVITLGRLWGHLPPNSRKYRLFANFCHLVYAAKIATMRSISSTSAMEFENNMVTYLHGLDELFPTYQLVPSHHIVLHMKELLCYVFLTYHCAHNGLPLGPSSLLRHTSPSRTDYDSYTSF